MPTPLMPVLGGCWREGNFAGTGLQLRETETQQTQSVPHVHTCRQRIESFHANRTRLAVFTLPHLLYTNCFPVFFFLFFFNESTPWSRTFLDLLTIEYRSKPP